MVKVHFEGRVNQTWKWSRCRGWQGGVKNDIPPPANQFSGLRERLDESASSWDRKDSKQSRSDVTTQNAAFEYIQFIITMRHPRKSGELSSGQRDLRWPDISGKQTWCKDWNLINCWYTGVPSQEKPSQWPRERVGRIDRRGHCVEFCPTLHFKH